VLFKDRTGTLDGKSGFPACPSPLWSCRRFGSRRNHDGVCQRWSVTLRPVAQLYFYVPTGQVIEAVAVARMTV